MRRNAMKWIAPLALCLVLALTVVPALAAGERTFGSNETIGDTTITENTTWNIPQGVTVTVTGSITVNNGAP